VKELLRRALARAGPGARSLAGGGAPGGLLQIDLNPGHMVRGEDGRLGAPPPDVEELLSFLRTLVRCACACARAAAAPCTVRRPHARTRLGLLSRALLLLPPPPLLLPCALGWDAPAPTAPRSRARPAPPATANKTHKRAQGVPVVQAPGEAEAMCAALSSEGLVDAAHSKDADTMVFGAEVSYKLMKLLSGSPEKCQLHVVRMESIRQTLGLAAGGAAALTAAAVLIGGDYNYGGASGVGHTMAWRAVRFLLRGKQARRSHNRRLAPVPLSRA